MSANSFLNGAMTVKQLRKALEDYPDDAPVVVSCDYGDRGNTQQVLAFDAVDGISRGEVCESGYSTSGYALGDEEDDADELEEDDEDEDCGTGPVVVLKA